MGSGFSVVVHCPIPFVLGIIGTFIALQIALKGIIGHHVKDEKLGDKSAKDKILHRLGALCMCMGDDCKSMCQAAVAEAGITLALMSASIAIVIIIMAISGKCKSQTGIGAPAL